MFDESIDYNCNHQNPESHLVTYSVKVTPEIKELLQNLVLVSKRSRPYYGRTEPIASQRALLEDMLEVYEIAHPALFTKARSIQVVYSPETVQENVSDK